MKVIKPLKPDASNYKPHRCPWGYRNPKNHLFPKMFEKLILGMLDSKDQQHITCPGCGRSIYLTIRIEGHNKPGMHGKMPPRIHEHWED